MADETASNTDWPYPWLPTPAEVEAKLKELGLVPTVKKAKGVAKVQRERHPSRAERWKAATDDLEAALGLPQDIGGHAISNATAALDTLTMEYALWNGQLHPSLKDSKVAKQLEALANFSVTGTLDRLGGDTAELIKALRGMEHPVPYFG